MTENASEKENLESLNVRLDRLEDSIKEREHNLFRAIKTFVQDFLSFRAGEQGFPRAAALGLVFAYLRPRIVLVLGSFAAVGLAGMQVWLLLSQNKLIEQQNLMIDNQARSNRMQAIAAVLTGADPSNPAPVVLAQLSVYGSEGFDVLDELAATDVPAAYPFLFAGAKRHDGLQALKVVGRLLHEIGKEFKHDFDSNRAVNIVTPSEWRRSRPPNVQTDAMTRWSLDLNKYVNRAASLGTYTPRSYMESSQFLSEIADIYLHYGVVVDASKEHDLEPYLRKEPAPCEVTC
jgi:hypothetical protein